jgi:glycine/D-amino acid oxidase-like deaminating enzyme
MKRMAEVVVIGGGVVGAAIAYGVSGHGAHVTVLDEGDIAFRASRVNFGLVWLHSKGAGMPEYGFWTRRACDLWPRFAAELKEATGIDTHYVKSGGLSYCLGEAEYGKRSELVQRMRVQAERDPYETRMLDRSDLMQLMPRAALGPEVLGASYGPHDGHVNPLNLLRALHAGLVRRGVDYRAGSPAVSVAPSAGGFDVVTARDTWTTPKVVLAAGHGSVALMGGLGFEVRIRAERGQQLVTERCAPVLPLPANGIRQSAEGTVLIGSWVTTCRPRWTAAPGWRRAHCVSCPRCPAYASYAAGRDCARSPTTSVRCTRNRHAIPVRSSRLAIPASR